MTETSKGSSIWNSALMHRDLIQKHSFWEVKDGGTARFWTDSWQQFPCLVNVIQGIPAHHIQSQETVNHFWQNTQDMDRRIWKKGQEILPDSPEEVQRTLVDELQKRKILQGTEPDKLRWGYEEKGTYTTKEAYLLILKDQLIKDKLWEKVWSPRIWPKISTFLWLLSHNRILTWDNLRKRKFEGPSICLNCKMEEETAVHLMQLCPFSRILWEKVTFRCQKEGRKIGDLNNTIRNWPQAPYQSNILNTLWQIIPGIVMWNLWKERNRRIFKNQSMDEQQVWQIIYKNVQETLSLQRWSQEDFPSNNKEQAIWNNWQLHLQFPTILPIISSK